MVKLPGVVTEGGHQPAIRPLPFLTWIFYRTVREIEGPRYLRSPCQALSPGSGASPLFAYAQVIAAPSSASPTPIITYMPFCSQGRDERKSHHILIF